MATATEQYEAIYKVIDKADAFDFVHNPSNGRYDLVCGWDEGDRDFLNPGGGRMPAYGLLLAPRNAWDLEAFGSRSLRVEALLEMLVYAVAEGLLEYNRGYVVVRDSGNTIKNIMDNATMLTEMGVGIRCCLVPVEERNLYDIVSGPALDAGMVLDIDGRLPVRCGWAGRREPWGVFEENARYLAAYQIAGTVERLRYDCNLHAISAREYPPERLTVDGPWDILDALSCGADIFPELGSRPSRDEKVPYPAYTCALTKLFEEGRPLAPYKEALTRAQDIVGIWRGCLKASGIEIGNDATTPAELVEVLRHTASLIGVGSAVEAYCSGVPLDDIEIPPVVWKRS